MQQRKRYREEFKREAVGLTRLPGASVSQIARDLGIRADASWRWSARRPSLATASPATRSCWHSSWNWRG